MHTSSSFEINFWSQAKGVYFLSNLMDGFLEELTIRVIQYKFEFWYLD